MSEKSKRCPRCGSDIGHRVNCPGGIAFSDDHDMFPLIPERKNLRRNEMAGCIQNGHVWITGPTRAAAEIAPRPDDLCECKMWTWDQYISSEPIYTQMTTELVQAKIARLIAGGNAVANRVVILEQQAVKLRSALDDIASLAGSYVGSVYAVDLLSLLDEISLKAHGALEVGLR